MNAADPGTFLALIILGGVVLSGAYFFMREIFADALDLHEKRKAQRHDAERREGRTK